MTITEFASKAGFFPKDEHMERVNCPLVGQFMHQNCGCCSSCGIPKSAVCACRWPVEANSIQHRADCHNARLWAENTTRLLQENCVPKYAWDLDFLHDCYMRGDTPSEAVNSLLEELTSP